MKKGFSLDVRKAVFAKFNYICANFKNTDKCLINQGLEIHHLVSNTIVNSRLYGEDNIQSEDNALLLCKYCHDNQAIFPSIQALETQNRAKWLSQNP